jgi:voltage-gated potassium channel
MKRTNSFILFGRAFKNAKKDFWVSIQVLFWITLGLAAVFYVVEHMAQPEEYSNPWDAFVWAITRYIGDPGHFAGKGPVTLTGRYIDTIIGILKILIFAVPAGLVSNGFRKAMEEDKRKIHLEECRERIRKSFRRVLNKSTRYRVPPRNVSIVTLQAKKGMTENDVIDTVTEFPEFRLRNLATSQTHSEHPQDRLVIEMLPLFDKTVDGFEIKQTKYGICINRESNVTIIAPTSGTECSIGSFAFYVAQFGCFNFVSREFVNDVDDPVSYFTINDANKENINDFIVDIETLSKSKEHWNIILISADNVHDTQIHLIHKMKNGGENGLTNLNEEQFQQFYANLSDVLSQNHQLLCDLDEKYQPVGQKNIGVIVGGGKDNNTFSMRISYSVTTWIDTYSPIVLDIAKVIKQNLEIDSKKAFVEHPGWKEKGFGYGDKIMRELKKQE